MWWIDKKRRRENEMKRNDKWIGNQIGDEGAKRISESLKINTSLTELDLIGDEKKMEREYNERNEEMNR